MRTTTTITDLDHKFRNEVIGLTKEYDNQKLLPQTFADYVVAKTSVYEQQYIEITGRQLRGVQ